MVKNKNKSNKYEFLTEKQKDLIELRKSKEKIRSQQKEYEKAERTEKAEKPLPRAVKGITRGYERYERAKRKAFTTQEGRKVVARRAKAVRGILRATGVIGGEQRYSGAGRPRGSYIHGMPIHVWKRLERERKIKFQEFQQEQQMKFASQGFTPEQVQQLQQQQTIEELQQPTQPQALQQLQARQQRIQMLQQAQQGVMPQQIQQNIPQPRYAQDMPFQNPSDEQLEFMRWKAERTIHPNTQRMLQEVRRIQLLGKTANIEHARRNRERNMLGRQMNLMKAHENMTKVSMDITGVNSDNILFAPSVFKENPENNILKPNRLNLLQTREGGNNLNFW